jgi:DNA-binding beta-propeller fold protein YncE
VSKVRAARGFTGLVATSLLILTFSATADAGEPHVFAYSFNGSGATMLNRASGVAVDNSAGPSRGDVYVADWGPQRIEKFDADGELILTFPVPGSPLFVAVDSSNGPSAGDVYVAQWEPDRVLKFDPSGNPIASWREGGKLTLSQSSGGIAVGPDGKLVVQSGWSTEGGTISTYDQGGSAVSSFPLQRWSGGNGIGVDGSGDIYVSSQLGIERYDPSGTDLGVVDGIEGADAIAIDRSAGRIYVRHREGSIDEFSAACTTGECVPETSFGSGYLGRGSDLDGIAVDEATGTVFTADYEYGRWEQSRIAVFDPPGILAEATTLQSGSVSDHGAELFGRVDPAGAGPVLACRFYYVTEAEYRFGGFEGAPSAPCEPGPSYVSSTNVSATLSGLTQDTSYRYRLVGANGNGDSLGGDREFRTAPSLPQIVTGPISSLGPESATASGSIGTGGGAPVQGCFFQYVSAATFAATGYAEAELSACVVPHGFSNNTPVSEELKHLSPNTAYRYRLVAWNRWGYGYGQDREFTTSAKPVAQPEEPEEEEEEEKEPHPRHVHCIRNACAHKLRASAEPRTWTSPRYPAAYAWEAAVRSNGRWMPHTRLVGGCVATFRTKALVVRLNGCHGHVRVRYVGDGTFTVVWQLFK